MSTSDSKYYTSLQYQEYIDENENYCVNKESPKTFAKSVKSGYSKHLNNKGPSFYKFYVRISSDKKLYDPFPKYSVSDNRASFVDKVCKDNNSYKEVTENIFNMYLSYLRTENTQWYNKAQRELLNIR